MSISTSGTDRFEEIPQQKGSANDSGSLANVSSGGVMSTLFFRRLRRNQGGDGPSTRRKGEKTAVRMLTGERPSGGEDPREGEGEEGEDGRRRSLAAGGGGFYRGGGGVGGGIRKKKKRGGFFTSGQEEGGDEESWMQELEGYSLYSPAEEEKDATERRRLAGRDLQMLLCISEGLSHLLTASSKLRDLWGR